MTRFTGPRHHSTEVMQLQLDLLHELHSWNISLIFCEVTEKNIICLSEIYLFSINTANPGFCFWSRLQGLGLIFYDLPALSLSMHQGSCKPFTKPDLKYGTSIHHEILLVRASLGPLTRIMWWNSTTSWSASNFTTPSASQESSAF